MNQFYFFKWIEYVERRRLLGEVGLLGTSLIPLWYILFLSTISPFPFEFWDLITWLSVSAEKGSMDELVVVCPLLLCHLLSSFSFCFFWLALCFGYDVVWITGSPCSVFCISMSILNALRVLVLVGTYFMFRGKIVPLWCLSVLGATEDSKLCTSFF